MEKFGRLLVNSQVITSAECDNAFDHLEGSSIHLSEFLVEGGYASDSAILGTVSRTLKLPRVSLEAAEPEPRALMKVPESVCRTWLVLPLEVTRGKMGLHLVLAMANPLDDEALHHVAEASDMRIKPFVASARALRVALDRTFGPSTIEQPGRPFRRSTPAGLNPPSIDVPTIQDETSPQVQTLERFVTALASSPQPPQLSRDELLERLQVFVKGAATIHERLVLLLLHDLVESKQYSVQQAMMLLRRSADSSTD
ncbi:MAG: hypothetical protein VX589_04620 [Myxococcota bacterium]|nr:hypothetical protein [Myxococcota bacterium]